MPQISVVINFCSNDYPFLSHCIAAVKPFASQILIPVCDHFFDGIPEDQARLNRIFREHPDVHFIVFPFDPSRIPYAHYGNAYWHNIARLVATYYLDSQTEYVLYLDCDEVVETKRFCNWLTQFDYPSFTAIRFATYWYFREATLRALTWEDMPLLIQKKCVNGHEIMKPLQRCGMHDDAPGKTIRMLTGLDGNPLFHHYSFVRTKEQMLRKVRAWGHNKDRDWIPDVEKEFASAFTGTDFVRGYQFQTVSPYCPIDLNAEPLHTATTTHHVTHLSTSDVYKIEIALIFDL